MKNILLTTLALVRTIGIIILFFAAASHYHPVNDVSRNLVVKQGN